MAGKWSGRFRSRTNQTVDEVHQKKETYQYICGMSFFWKLSILVTDRSDHNVDFVVNDKHVFLPLTFAVEFARNGILTAVRTIPRKHRTR